MPDIPDASGGSAGSAHRLLVVIVAVPLLAAFALWAFAWPAARMAPRDLPLGVAGPPAAVSQVEHRLAEREGMFEVRQFTDEDAARRAIEQRKIYGAVVVSAKGPQILTASAASPAVAQLLRESAASLQPKAPGGDKRPPEGGAPLTAVEDVVPAPAGDPRGSAFGASILPLVLSGVAAGALTALSGLRGARAVGALVACTPLVGLVGAGVAHSWLGVLEGPWWLVAGGITLTTLAVAATVAGLHAVLGKPGVAVGALLVVLLGNPFSGAAGGPHVLPEPLGTLGQLLAPGAGASLLRSVSFFDGAAAGTPVLVLAAWAVAGLLGVVLARSRSQA